MRHTILVLEPAAPLFFSAFREFLPQLVYFSLRLAAHEDMAGEKGNCGPPFSAKRASHGAGGAGRGRAGPPRRLGRHGILGRSRSQIGSERAGTHLRSPSVINRDPRLDLRYMFDHWISTRRRFSNSMRYPALGHLRRDVPGGRGASRAAPRRSGPRGSGGGPMPRDGSGHICGRAGARAG